MPDITGTKVIKLQPGSAKVPVTITLSVCSSATANDGQIPYGDTLTGATLKAYAPDGSDVTSSLVTTAAAISGTSPTYTVSAKISYYAGIVAGRHKLTWVYTCASGYTDEIDANRVQVGDT